MSKNLLIIFALIFASLLSFSQSTSITYNQYVLGSENSDTTEIAVIQSDSKVKIESLERLPEKPIPGLANEITFLDYSKGEIISQLVYKDSSYFAKQAMHTPAYEFLNDTTTILGLRCKKAQTTINSNRIEVWYTNQLGIEFSPVSWLGNFEGAILKIVRNGNRVIEANEISQVKATEKFIPDDLGTAISSQQLNQLQKEKLVMRIPVFSDQQIFWGDTSALPAEIPYDSSLHTAGGTLIFKRMQLPEVPDHYQIFAEVSTHSNGDAYDRTGSVFVIPDGDISFLDAMLDGIDKLPVISGKDGESYQGFQLTESYLPPVELLRFFTPFGVRHFNDRVQLDSLEWATEAYYKQDISDLRSSLSGDVMLAVFIGNYDRGGHKLSLNLSFYPGSTVWEDQNDFKNWSLPLFNTLNAMEMAGQNYGKLFGTDTLTIAFDVPEGVEKLRLRYISTGHGGWGGGDEFNPKENKIFIDGVLRFVHTPWRTDCATYRDLNPVSGNFWNGMSSSDFSRSGWCPGEATEPVYFNLENMQPGKHRISIVIPQGKAEGNSISFWAVSGMLIGQKKVTIAD
jgi:GLPGLI family protein